jgi:hypothetical protein
MANHAATLCHHCGKEDTDPKSHWNTGETFHFDCLPYDKRQELVESHPHAQSILDAVHSGVKGEKLRAHITSLPAAVEDES